MAITSLDKSKIRILLLEGIHQSAVDTLIDAGYTNIERLPHALPEEELIAKICNVHFLGIRSRTRLTERVFEATDKLLSVGCFGIGTNQVDLNAATRRGVAVFNAPFSNSRSVAELVLAEAIMLLRGIPAKSAAAHRGVWMKHAKDSFEVRGKKLGIVGYGNIGSQLSVLAESLGMDVLFYDVVTKLPLGNAVQVLSLDTLLERSDIISLHVPETQSTRNMIDYKQLALMKPTSILINASRGTVVNIDVLAGMLRQDKLLGAAIDVFPIEPPSNDHDFVSPLCGIDNVILTPHIGGSTLEAQINIGTEVAEKLSKYSDTGTTVSSVNLPEVALPSHPGQHRLLHIHENIPGVMSEINNIFCNNKINILSQYLRTNEAIGYAVIDVGQEYSELALKKLRSVQGTVKCRVLF
ncbi:phosphoglycerate dehydrogenase [Halomonas salipaludis]|uniref:2-oxoglutarate reductase n=1 Tax=Halomonas salipaludis TaxID=2032625 RepID=A0A2A2ETF0_9GAMM|nr:phosphoglycerate dehydrogenase [Halomonas salipaludis]PAU75583.1 D-3-phosphoglycerate dehydrogenase [Halomonas salipaludis]